MGRNESSWCYRKRCGRESWKTVPLVLELPIMSCDCVKIGKLKQTIHAIVPTLRVGTHRPDAPASIDARPKKQHWLAILTTQERRKISFPRGAWERE